MEREGEEALGAGEKAWAETGWWSSGEVSNGVEVGVELLWLC